MTKYIPSLFVFCLASAWIWERFPYIEAILATILLLGLYIAAYGTGYKQAAEDFDSVLDKLDQPEEK